MAKAINPILRSPVPHFIQAGLFGGGGGCEGLADSVRRTGTWCKALSADGEWRAVWEEKVVVSRVKRRMRAGEEGDGFRNERRREGGGGIAVRKVEGFRDVGGRGAGKTS